MAQFHGIARGPESEFDLQKPGGECSDKESTHEKGQKGSSTTLHGGNKKDMQRVNGKHDQKRASKCGYACVCIYQRINHNHRANEPLSRQQQNGIE